MLKSFEKHSNIEVEGGDCKKNLFKEMQRAVKT